MRMPLAMVPLYNFVLEWCCHGHLSSVVCCGWLVVVVVVVASEMVCVD